MKKIHSRLTAFLPSIYVIKLDQYSPAIPTLRRQKNNINCPPFFFFVTSIKFVACALQENRSPGVQISRDICTRFKSYKGQLDNKGVYHRKRNPDKVSQSQ